MGNSKHSVVSSVSLPEREDPHRNHHRSFRNQLTRRKSDPNDYAEVQLGRLRSIDFRLGKVLVQSGTLSSARTDGLLLDRLWTPDTFVFSRTCEKHHCGFGFSCDISFQDGDTGLYIVRQIPKPRKGFKGMEDSPLDIFDIRPQIQRQVLGLVVKKSDPEPGQINKDNSKNFSDLSDLHQVQVLDGITVFSVQGVLGHVTVKEDWTQAYDILNSEGEQAFLAQRFNRISGGVEFQIYSVKTDSETQTQPQPRTVCLATLVRLEESKFILKVYVPSPPVLKALMISFTLFLIYLLSR